MDDDADNDSDDDANDDTDDDSIHPLRLLSTCDDLSCPGRRTSSLLGSPRRSLLHELATSSLLHTLLRSLVTSNPSMTKARSSLVWEFCLSWTVVTWFKDRALTRRLAAVERKLAATELDNLALRGQKDRLVTELAQANTTIEAISQGLRTGAERDQNVQMTAAALANGQA